MGQTRTRRTQGASAFSTGKNVCQQAFLCFSSPSGSLQILPYRAGSGHCGFPQERGLVRKRERPEYRRHLPPQKAMHCRRRSGEVQSCVGHRGSGRAAVGLVNPSEKEGHPLVGHEGLEKAKKDAVTVCFCTSEARTDAKKRRDSQPFRPPTT